MPCHFGIDGFPGPVTLDMTGPAVGQDMRRIVRVASRLSPAVRGALQICFHACRSSGICTRHAGIPAAVSRPAPLIVSMMFNAHIAVPRRHVTPCKRCKKIYIPVQTYNAPVRAILTVQGSVLSPRFAAGPFEDSCSEYQRRRNVIAA